MSNLYEKKLSILVPTNRPFDGYLNKLIYSILKFNPTYSYEICVFSNERIEGENVVWYEENGRQGPIYGFNHMVKDCKGEYIVCVTDDQEIHSSIDFIVDFMENNFGEYEEFIVSSLSCGDSGCFTPSLGELFGESLVEWQERYPIIRFPIFHKKTIEKLGNVIFNESFFYHAADNWLGFFLGKNGYSFKNCPVEIRPHNQQTDNSYLKKDCEVARKLMSELINNQIDYNYKVV